MMTAKQARERVADMTNTVATDQISRISKAVSEACERAKTETYVGFRVIPSVKEKLEGEGFGYKITIIEDFREGSYTGISW